MSRIEFREWPKAPPEHDIPARPIFRLPLPPLNVTLGRMLKLASLMLALGIGLMMLNILHYHFPYAVVPLLVGCVTANTVTAGLRLIWPTINLHVLAQTCNVFLTLCIALWMWRVLTTGGIGPSIEHGMAPIVVFVGVYFVFSFAPFFAFGRTAGDSLRSALVFFVALVTVKLPFVFTAEVAWALAILQIGANMALAWMIGSNHARYLLTDHLLTLGQSNRGWTAFGWLYQLPPLMLLPALLLTVSILLGDDRLGLTIFSIALVPMITVYWTAIWKLHFGAQLLWFGYQETGAVAAMGTFRFSGLLSPAVRRGLYFAVVVLNTAAERAKMAGADIGLEASPGHILSFIVPALLPFYFCVMLNTIALFVLQLATAWEEVNND